MTRIISALTALLFAPAIAFAAAEPGKPAPDFTAKDIAGVEHSISGHKGQIVVLEWHNEGCPFVVKHYDSKNMQALQAAATKDGVVWLTINSGAPGKQGHFTPEQAKAYIAKHGAAQSAYIIDEAGAIGKAYGAKTTPHMFVIDKDGTIAYAGAIDDNNSANKEDALTAKNYVTAALASLKEGKKPEVSATQPYGCGVKYAD